MQNRVFALTYSLKTSPPYIFMIAPPRLKILYLRYGAQTRTPFDPFTKNLLQLLSLLLKLNFDEKC